MSCGSTDEAVMSNFANSRITDAVKTSALTSGLTCYTSTNSGAKGVFPFVYPDTKSNGGVDCRAYHDLDKAVTTCEATGEKIARICHCSPGFDYMGNGTNTHTRMHTHTHTLTHLH